MAEIVAGGVSSEWEAIDERALDAARWTDREIVNLIEQVKKFGNVNSFGQTEILFGLLFNETGNMFDALSGLLKTAKK